MTRLLVFGGKAEELAKIKRAAGSVKLRVDKVAGILYRQKVGKLAQANLVSLLENVQMGDEEECYLGKPVDESMVLFCGLTEKQLDKILAALKREGAGIDYKAVLTKENANWNVLRLFAELAREKAAYGKG